MEKAYDFKGLAEKLKAQGLELAEESAKMALVAVFEWLEESAKMSKTPYDDLALVLFPQLKSLIEEKVEDINKEDNE